VMLSVSAWMTVRSATSSLMLSSGAGRGAVFRYQADPPPQNVHRPAKGCCAHPFRAFDHAGHGLAQHPFVTADDRAGGRAAAVDGSQFELLGSQGIE